MCDLEVAVLASNSYKIFGGHNTSRLKNSTTLALHYKTFITYEKGLSIAL
jgi:hypothetical protein